MDETIIPLLEKAIAAREALFDERHRSALRLFNGFLEGCPDLVVDLYAATAVLYNHAERAEQGLPMVQAAEAFLREHLPWLRAGIVKIRNSSLVEEKRGKLLFGEEPDRKVEEGGVWYALDLRMNQDASLYLDTRNLREWLVEHMKGKTVLNTFAYTGSLGVAACAGGATRVVQLDLSRQFLNLAKTSYTLNGFPIHKADFIAGDFWSLVNQFKRRGERFDCVLVDPPFFSATIQRCTGSEHGQRPADQQGAPAGERRRLAGVGQQRPVCEREGVHGDAGGVVRGRVPENRGTDPGTGGFYRVCGDPERKTHHGPEPVQPFDEDRGAGGEEEEGRLRRSIPDSFLRNKRGTKTSRCSFI